MVATNMTNLKFDEGSDVRIISDSGNTSHSPTSMEILPYGVLYDANILGANMRVFLPWHRVHKIEVPL